MRGLAVAVAGALALLVVSSCSDGVAPAGNAIAGTYLLRGINGHLPPQVVSDDGGAAESIVMGVVILGDDNAYVDSTEVQIVTETGIAMRFDVGRGVWRTSNDSVFFRFGESEYAMRRDGIELVQDFGGIELVYRR